MRIGVDVDGVLVNTAGFMHKYGRRFFRKAPVDPSGYTIEEIFDVSGLPVLLFGIRWFFPYYCRNYPPFPYADKVYKDLDRNGHKIYQITARKFTLSRSPLGKASLKLLKNWLRKNGFKYNKLILCDEKNVAEEKLRYCRQYHIQVMLDDNPETAEMLAKNNIRVLLYDAPYNKNIAHELITRVGNWKDIEKQLKIIEKTL
jgi:hypothetical protein